MRQYNLYDNIITNALQSQVNGLMFEFLPPGDGKAISIKTPAAVARRYVDGGYTVQITYTVVYRSIPHDDSGRKAADATLYEIISDMLFGQGIYHTEDGHRLIIRNADTTGASMLTRYDNGTEDHTADITLQYEVI